MASCAVATCTNHYYKTKDKNIIYYRFPKSLHLVKAWINKCKRQDDINVRNAKICCEHFVADDYIDDMKNRLLGLKEKRILKPDAVPSLNLPSHDICIETGRSQRKRKRNILKKPALDLRLDPSPKKICNPVTCDIKCEPEITSEGDTCLHCSNKMASLEKEKEVVEKMNETLQKKVRNMGSKISRLLYENSVLKSKLNILKAKFLNQSDIDKEIKIVLPSTQMNAFVNPNLKICWNAEDISRSLVTPPLFRKSYEYWGTSIPEQLQHTRKSPKRKCMTGKRNKNTRSIENLSDCEEKCTALTKKRISSVSQTSSSGDIKIKTECDTDVTSNAVDEMRIMTAENMPSTGVGKDDIERVRIIDVRSVEQREKPPIDILATQTTVVPYIKSEQTSDTVNEELPGVSGLHLPLKQAMPMSHISSVCIPTPTGETSGNKRIILPGLTKRIVLSGTPAVNLPVNHSVALSHNSIAGPSCTFTGGAPEAPGMQPVTLSCLSTEGTSVFSTKHVQVPGSPSLTLPVSQAARMPYNSAERLILSAGTSDIPIGEVTVHTQTATTAHLPTVETLVTRSISTSNAPENFKSSDKPATMEKPHVSVNLSITSAEEQPAYSSSHSFTRKTEDNSFRTCVDEDDERHVHSTSERLEKESDELHGFPPLRQHGSIIQILDSMNRNIEANTSALTTLSSNFIESFQENTRAVNNLATVLNNIESLLHRCLEKLSKKE